MLKPPTTPEVVMSRLVAESTVCTLVFDAESPPRPI